LKNNNKPDKLLERRARLLLVWEQRPAIRPVAATAEKGRIRLRRTSLLPQLSTIYSAASKQSGLPSKVDLDRTKG